jgi:hypothetical protein
MPSTPGASEKYSGKQSAKKLDTAFQTGMIMSERGVGGTKVCSISDRELFNKQYSAIGVA